MDNRVKKAYSIIRRNYKDRLLLDNLASEVGLSKFHLQRLFKAEFHESPSECLMRTRIERAAHFLTLKSNVPLSILASDCGFSSLSVFSRAFLKHYKVTPTTFLKQTDISKTIVKDVPNVEVIYCSEIRVLYEVTHIFNPELSMYYNKTKARVKHLGLLNHNRKIGIMNHLSVHKSDEKPNYFAGIEIKGKIPNKYKEDVFIIPEGKYACIKLNSPRENLLQELINLKYNWLDKSEYILKDFLAWEDFLGEGFINRRLFLPITLKR